MQSSHLCYTEDTKKKKQESEIKLLETAQKYYKEQNYNCAECILHACNEVYGLNLDEEHMRMMAVFGGGMYVGSTCGALVGCACALSKMVTKDRAHLETDTVPPAIRLLYRNFNQTLNGTQCTQLKVQHHHPEERCWKTVSLACEAMDKTVQELSEKGIIHEQYTRNI